MKRRPWVLLVVMLVVLAAALPVLAGVSDVGTVYEGRSVPGAELGFSRAEIEAAYGQPNYCQSHALPGDQLICTFRAPGGGLVSVMYRGADGGFAHNAPDDVAVEFGWGEGLSGWTTTAGINTANAKTDPGAVLSAYPDAEVTGNPGVDGTVVDWLQGIRINWDFDGYTGSIHVGMRIFEPLASLPTTLETHVQDLELSAYRDRGVRKFNAWALILDEHGQAPTGARVYGEWGLPDGSTRAAYEDFVGLDATAFFQLIGKFKRGTYTFRVTDVQYPDHTFDAVGSVPGASVYIK